MTAGNEPADRTRDRAAQPRQSDGWSAVLDRSASGPSSLRVTGHYVLFMPPDVGVELRRHEPQGSDPTELSLDRVLNQESPDPASAVSIGGAMPRMRRTAVSYEERGGAEVEVVTIQPDGVRVTVTRSESSDPAGRAP